MDRKPLIEVYAPQQSGSADVTARTFVPAGQSAASTSPKPAAPKAVSVITKPKE